jgi:hypothetical protein
MTPLPAQLKKAAEDAFHDNFLLYAISPEDRELAARWYEDFAALTVGNRAELARLYNLERAAFLRGQVARIARNAPDFAVEIGYH